MTYAAIQSRAAAMLSAKGQTVTIAGETGSTYDTSTSEATGTAYTAAAKAVVLPLSPYRQANDSNAQSGDEQMFLAAVDTDGNALAKPPLNATVTLADGVTKYTLIAINPLHPDGTELLFDCVVRGA